MPHDQKQANPLRKGLLLLLLIGGAVLLARLATRVGAGIATLEPRAQTRLAARRTDRNAVKRLLDLVLASVALIVFAPVLVVVAILVRVKIGSPVFFLQERPGLDGKPFKIIKFRTMTDARDADGQLLPDAERMTSLGEFLRRTSLDELPELINVLRGEMSLVGPRALLMGYLPLYNSRQARRHEVRPGITGWAQVSGRNHVDWPERLEMDVQYVERRSLWLDLKILLLTVWTVLKQEGISEEGQATMSRFTGNGPDDGSTPKSEDFEQAA